MNKDGNNPKLSIEMGTLLPYLVKGIQEQQTQINKLTEHLTKLTEQVNLLTKLLSPV